MRMDDTRESANASDHMKMWPRNVVTESDRFCGHFAAASFGRQGRGHGVHSPPVSPICCLPQLTLLLMSVWRWLLFRLWGFDERSLRCQFFLFETCTVLSRTLLSMRATPFNSIKFLNVQQFYASNDACVIYLILLHKKARKGIFLKMWT